ncbi:hypothetical protein OESDEN_09471 [Oesophagostomum dentatum]|uniref:G-protein coupled receptors family 1 profile domain-containing protein n=1 Tax=Oesophagostomum dentatum TaxID=61180 RepID=A0A0B1T4I6_OESDE|nr:hypothetical protein OESDEN_09471 [Oesophagostomum dentatum]
MLPINVCYLTLRTMKPNRKQHRKAPLGVFLEKGCDYHLAICILLTILGYIPGIIYACYVILAY